nr:GNAT family N-acetyltransferase [Propionicimonas sp.]
MSKPRSQRARGTGRAGEASLVLRPAVVADASDIARIWREGWLDAHLGHVPAELVAARTSASFEERAIDRIAGTIVADGPEAAVGFVMIDGDQVDQLYLDRSARGAGVGAALLAEAERIVLSAGHRQAWLAVASGNEAARRFYARQRWIDEGVIAYPAPVPGGVVDVDCHRFVSPPRA